MNLHKLLDYLYSLMPFIYDLQLYFFNGNHFKVLKRKLIKIPKESILEIGCGTAPILKEFHPKKYVGIDIEKKFIDLAKKKYAKKEYKFIIMDAKEIDIKDDFDIVLFSHTTHHFSDKELIKIFTKLQKFKFKYLVIYDGRPIGFSSPLLTKLDYDAAKFRKAKDFIPLFTDSYKLIKAENFRSNRPFYEYPLIIAQKN